MRRKSQVVNAISRGDLHALDNFCDLAGPVAARIGQFVHLGRVHLHILLVIAVVVLVINLITGRRPAL